MAEYLSRHPVEKKTFSCGSFGILERFLMYLDEALLLGVLTKEALAKREVYCAILEGPPAERGVSIHDAQEVDWPGYPKGGVSVSTERVGEVYTANGDTADALILLGSCTVPNTSDEAWRVKDITVAYYFRDSETRKIIYCSQLAVDLWLDAGHTLTIPPLIVM